MRIPFDPSLSLRALPPARALVLTAIAVLLAAADWLPANPYVDADHLEFGLTLSWVSPRSAFASAIALSQTPFAAGNLEYCSAS